MDLNCHREPPLYKHLVVIRKLFVVADKLQEQQRYEDKEYGEKGNADRDIQREQVSHKDKLEQMEEYARQTDDDK